MQRLERGLLLRQVVGSCQERFDPLVQAVDLLIERDEALLLRRERAHPAFRVAHRRLQRADALVERLEFALADRQRADLGAHRFEERRGVFLQLRGLALHVVVQLRRRVHALIRVLGQLLDPADRLLGLRHLLHAFIELRNLRVHRPHHLADAVGLDDGVFDGLLLALDGLGLAADVL